MEDAIQGQLRTRESLAGSSLGRVGGLGRSGVHGDVSTLARNLPCAFLDLASRHAVSESFADV